MARSGANGDLRKELVARDSHGKNRRGKWSTLGIRHLHGEGRVGAATIGLVTKGMIPNGVILVAGRARATREDIAMQSPWTRLGRSPTIRNRVRYTRKNFFRIGRRIGKLGKMRVPGSEEALPAPTEASAVRLSVSPPLSNRESSLRLELEAPLMQPPGKQLAR